MLVYGLCLPDKYRIEFSHPRGIVFTGIPSENSRLIKRKKFFKDKPIIAIGDIVAETILQSDLRPFLIIVDYRTKRTIRRGYITGLEVKEKYKVANPPGMVSLKALNILRDALTNDSIQAPILVEIIGEEDLLVLPSILYSRDKTIIVYGQPDKGMVIVEVDSITRKTALNFWVLLKPCIKQV